MAALILDRIDNGWLLSSPGLFTRYFANGRDVLPFVREWIDNEEITWIFPPKPSEDDDSDDSGNYS